MPPSRPRSKSLRSARHDLHQHHPIGCLNNCWKCKCSVEYVYLVQLELAILPLSSVCISQFQAWTALLSRHLCTSTGIGEFLSHTLETCGGVILKQFFFFKKKAHQNKGQRSKKNSAVCHSARDKSRSSVAERDRLTALTPSLPLWPALNPRGEWATKYTCSHRLFSSTGGKTKASAKWHGIQNKSQTWSWNCSICSGTANASSARNERIVKKNYITKLFLFLTTRGTYYFSPLCSCMQLLIISLNRVRQKMHNRKCRSHLTSIIFFIRQHVENFKS